MPKLSKKLNKKISKFAKTTETNKQKAQRRKSERKAKKAQRELQKDVLKTKRSDNVKNGQRKVTKRATKKSDKGLSLKEMLRATDQFPMIAARGRSMRLLKAKRDLTSTGAVLTVTCKSHLWHSTHKPPRPRPVVVQAVNGYEKLSHNRAKLKVSCFCEHFQFTCDYVLWTHGASDKLTLQGTPFENSPPYITNPGLSVLTCKHIYAVLKRIKQNGL